MKKITFFIALLFSITDYGFSQQPCATELSPQMKDWLIYYSGHKDQFQANSNRETFYIPLKIHLVGTSDSKSYYRLDFLWTLLCELNQKYTETGFYFYLYEDVHYIANDSYYLLDFNTGSEMMLQNNVPGVANIYLVGDPAGYCGYYTYFEDAITVAKSCSNPASTTLAHELGHYFSLPHPFDQVTGVAEYVDGSNCSFAGDLFCDTRADFLDYRWQCPYVGTEVDGHGDEYDPDETLYMSYSYDNCATRFSNEEMGAMVSNLITNRSDLLNHSLPDVTPLTTAPEYVTPIDSIADVPNDWVEFQWKPVDGADFYNLQVTYTLNFITTPMIDVIVNNTAYTTTLWPDKTYRWRVIPVKRGNMCVPEVPVQVFTTVQGTGVSNAQSASAGFKIFPTLVRTSSAFHVSLNSENNGTGHIQVISVNGNIVNDIPVTVIRGTNDWKITSSDLLPGMYLVNISFNDLIYQQKIVVTQ